MLLSNYKEHPTKTNYLVFQYTNQAMSDHFKRLLNERNIEFEYDESDFNDKTLFLFGVKTAHRNEAVKCNFIAFGTHRKPLINNKFLKFFILLIFACLISLAVIGYLKS